MKNIYLVGFMGTGKTKTARLLAKQLDKVFLDMDELIIERQKMPISDIFKIKGEPYFRKIERNLVIELSEKEDCIVACGGGVFANQENIDILKNNGIVVCLTSLPKTIFKRVSKTKLRPLLNVENPKARIEELLKKRQLFYSQAHYTIDADKLTVKEAVEEILKVINL